MKKQKNLITISVEEGLFYWEADKTLTGTQKAGPYDTINECLNDMDSFINSPDVMQKLICLYC